MTLLARRWMRSVVGLGALALAAACTSTTSGDEGKTSDLRSEMSQGVARDLEQEVTQAVTQAVGRTWVPVTDDKTGIRFSLPGESQLASTPQPSGGGPRVERRTYDVPIGRFVRTRVYIDSGVTKPVRYDQSPTTIADGLAGATRADGNTDVRRVDRANVTVKGHSGLDFRLTYTSKSHGDKTVILERAIQARTAIVVLLTFVSLGESVPLATLGGLQAKLVASLALP